MNTQADTLSHRKRRIPKHERDIDADKSFTGTDARVSIVCAAPAAEENAVVDFAGDDDDDALVLVVLLVVASLHRVGISSSESSVAAAPLP
jgi:hypothetical protein